MILDKLRCPDCDGGGVDRKRGGLCSRCNGGGKTQLTAAEQEARKICRCQGGTGPCDGGCGF